MHYKDWMKKNMFPVTGSLDSLPPLGSVRFRHACTLFKQDIIVAGGNSLSGDSVESLSLRFVTF
jgi:hypothetical protein